MVALALALACGDAPATTADTEGGASTGGATATGGMSSTSGATSTGEAESTSSGTTSSETPTSEVEPDPGTGLPPITTDSETTTTTSTTSTTGDDSTSTGTTGMSIPPVTRAWWVDGGTLQIRVIQEDAEAGLCRGVMLEALINGGSEMAKYEPVEQPDGWGIRYVFVHAMPENCLDPYDWWFETGAVYADSASGTATFHDVDDVGRPASLDVEITSIYAPGEPWVPAEELLLAVDVPVERG
jgi:hypothetical protein